ncbi:hypothetical protein TELCIR_04868 [Teladorsagia circumcincta]|uniref:Uncharacterized protein n=1 Tax=Teladorsagia circumcincta TaxID=45464 RepID=A0A2G9USC1_TELCI|nr:hypothetical protein TELCIR_04868 [Teladorsagia circumcincta]
MSKFQSSERRRYFAFLWSGHRRLWRNMDANTVFDSESAVFWR